ncbi:MAG: PIN domain-containing protein [Clostridiales bacterium]|nr:PIN domain-containing protein [Clostridiales bacterium]
MTNYLIDYENTGESGLAGLEALQEEDRVIIFYSENADKMSFGLHQKLWECQAQVEYRKIHTGKKNALDFQLATYLGYLMAKEETDVFYIVSKDTGFDFIVDFWENHKIGRIGAIAEKLRQPKPNDQPKPKNQPKQGKAAEPANPPKSENQSCQENSMKTENPPCQDNSAKAEIPPCQENPGKPADQPRDEAAAAVEAEGDTGLQERISELISEEEQQQTIYRFINKYKTKQGVNNALVKKYGSEKAGELYKKIKTLIKDKKGK